jgi:predicted RNA-binding Zn ribbon-like protein
MGYNKTMEEKRIRKGGIETPEGFLFELTGGDISLDFANTIVDRPTGEPRELIPTFKDLCSWGRQTGILSHEQEIAFNKKASRNGKKAENVRRFAIALRECMFQIFKRIIDNKDIPHDLLEQWNRFVHRSMQQHELVRSKEGFSWKCISDEKNFDSMLWPIIHSAVEIITGSNASRIRRCAAEECDWLFLDTSKRGNRRWCDMTVCGNRAKARRFYSRKKKGE